MKRFVTLVAVVCSLSVETTSQAEAIHRARYLMGTVCEVTAAQGSEGEVEAAFDEAGRIESMLSTWRSSSELSRLNASGSARVSAELFSVLSTALDWQRRTRGVFNPLLAPLISAWRTREEGTIPSPAELSSALARSSAANVSLGEPQTVHLRNGAAFEEGGFGKGYAIDRMLDAIHAPHVVINFGGQLAARGEQRVTIADPEERGRPVVALTIRDASLATSSGSEKTFTSGSRRFSHIIDPRSGEALPPRGSASALCADALTADILSTALYVMGPAEGLAWAETNGVAALFITPDRRIRMSSEFRRRARLLETLDRTFKQGD